MSAPSSWPPSESLIQAIHERYAIEIVEGLNLCPFARRAREQGRVHRPTFVAADASDEICPRRVARELAALQREHAEAEIILLTFPIPPGHPWSATSSFEGFLNELRAAWEAQPPVRELFMVSFHPRLTPPPDRPLTQDSLVSLLRRTPDPVIQCVDAEVLGRVRRQAQAGFHERMVRELEFKDPALAALFARSIHPDPELSADIARQNFRVLGGEPGRSRLENAIDSILEARDAAYGIERD